MDKARTILFLQDAFYALLESFLRSWIPIQLSRHTKMFAWGRRFHIFPLPSAVCFIQA